MFEFLRKIVAKKQVVERLLEPFDGRDGCIGGIESLVLDDVRYFFGFDFKSDLVLSPLVADIAEMSRFASLYMLQTDGAHDDGYWLESASYSIEDSELCYTPAERTFFSQSLNKSVNALRHAAETNSVAPGLSIEMNLLYLLNAAGAWQAQNATDVDVEERLAIVSGEKTPPEDSTVADHAQALLTESRMLIDAAPENWSTLFSVLKTA
jgi:hypothetical protein